MFTESAACWLQWTRRRGLIWWESEVSRLNTGCQNSKQRMLARKNQAEGIEYKPYTQSVIKSIISPKHTCSLLVKLTPLFGVALLPARSNWCGVDRSVGLMYRPAWLRTKPALLLARVLMCFLYWQRHRRTARRRGRRQARGARGETNRSFRAQTGQRWPFNLARCPAESLIKPRAVKTEQTAKPEPEMDTQSLALHSHFTPFFPFFLSIIPFQDLAAEATGKT